MDGERTCVFQLNQGSANFVNNLCLRWKLICSLTTVSLSSWKRESDWLSMGQVSMVGLVIRRGGLTHCEMLGGRNFLKRKTVPAEKLTPIASLNSQVQFPITN